MMKYFWWDENRFKTVTAHFISIIRSIIYILSTIRKDVGFEQIDSNENSPSLHP